MTLACRVVIGGLGLTLAVATWSGGLGLVDAVSFVSGREDAPRVSLGRSLEAAFSVVPADASFGFFAPQVSSEFRVRARVGSSATRRVEEVSLRLGPESQTLVSSLTSSTQRETAARAIATSVGSYALTRYPKSEYAEVTVEAEYLPELKDAPSEKPRWETIWRFLFKR